MEVEFRRTGERRYAVTIYRKDLPPVEMNPAPGYHPIMPHDLLHLAIESELGLTRGIFGQVAEGGHAGTFHRVLSITRDENRRDAARLRRSSKRAEKLLREGREDCAQSERATFICLYEWLARSSDPERRKVAAQMARGAKQTRDLQPRSESRALTEEFLVRVCARLDDLSRRWTALDIGQSFTVGWPGLGLTQQAYISLGKKAAC